MEGSESCVVLKNCYKGNKYCCYSRELSVGL